MNHLIILALLLAADPKPVVTCETKALVGHKFVLAAGASENVKAYRWEIEPVPSLVVKLTPNGSELLVAHDEPQIFKWRLDVTSPDGGLATSRGTFSVVAKAAAAPALAARERVYAVDDEGTDEETGYQPPMPTAEAVSGWLESVESATAEADARRIAAALMQEANALATGLASTESLVDDVGTLIRGSLTQRGWEDWTPFLEAMGAQFDLLAEEGMLASADDYVQELMTLARALKKFAAKGT